MRPVDPVAAAIGRVTEVRATSRRSMGAPSRSARVRALVACVEVAAEPVRAPLPHVPGHVVETERVRCEGVDGAGAEEAVVARVARRETLPARRSCDVCRPARARRPTGTGAARARRARRTPTRPRSVAAPKPMRSRRWRRPRRRVRRGAHRRPSSSDCGPSGWHHEAPSTCRHQGACSTARVSGKSSGRRPANTNDQPKRSASVA